MRLVRVGAAVLNQTPLDWDGNRARILGAVAEARAAGVGILCLPEMCIPGYGCEDAFHAPHVAATSLEILAEVAAAAKGMVVAAGLPIRHQGALFNCAALLVDGRVAGFVAKRFLAGDGIHYEPRWFKPWPAEIQAAVEYGGRDVPLGDVHFDVGGIRIGFEICEDAWVANRPGGDLSVRGVDLILNPSASHFAFGKYEVRKRFVLEGARAFGVTYVYANLLGNEAGRAIYDGGALIASGGKMLAQGPRLCFRDRILTHAVVDIDATRMGQARSASFRPDLREGVGDLVEAPFAVPEAAPERAVVEEAAWEKSAAIKEEEFTRAEALALWDYLRKSRSGGFVLSLSGGTDSAACAALVSYMARLAWTELGRDEVLARLSAAPRLGGDATDRDLVGKIFLCAYQATENSGAVTRGAARAVAEAVGAEFHDLDVDALAKAYVRLAEGVVGRALDWSTDDIALQNIQARVRSPGIWMLANLRNALLLSTSNRSEAAVGYATMDGDTCGGLSPLAGIDKAYLRAWLRWVETDGPDGLGKIPAMRSVNEQHSTAELRPARARQTSEGDLMPYPLLDAIERLLIRDRKSPVEIFRSLAVEFPQYGKSDLGIWIERFFRLWCRNQWKRERYAPSFHLDDENLDPKTWCRFPILSGGYERELAALREYVAGR